MSAQYKVKGQMITVEAEVPKTMEEKILPRNQKLIPVSLKRKLTYKGRVMEEIVSNSKFLAFFNYFKEHNPLFGDEVLDEQRIDELTQQLTNDTAIHEGHELADVGSNIQTVDPQNNDSYGTETEHQITNAVHDHETTSASISALISGS